MLTYEIRHKMGISATFIPDDQNSLTIPEQLAASVKKVANSNLLEVCGNLQELYYNL